MASAVSKSRSRRSKQKTKSASKKRNFFNRDNVMGLVVCFGLWLSIVVLILSKKTLPHTSLSLGQQAPETIAAAVDFSCDDIAETELAREKAAESVPPVFMINQDLYERQKRSLVKVVDKIINVRTAKPALPQEQQLQQLEETLYLLEIPITPDALMRMVPPGSEKHFEKEFLEALHQVWNEGIISTQERASEFGGIIKGGRLHLGVSKGSSYRPVSIKDVPLPAVAALQVVDRFKPDEESPGVPRSTLRLLAEALMAPNLVFMPQETEELREKALRAIDPIRMHVREGSIIVERGKVITPGVLAQVKAHETKISEMETPADRRLRLTGNSGTLALMLILCASLLKLLAPATSRKPMRILLMAVLSLLTIALVKLIYHQSTHSSLMAPGLAEFILPTGLAALLTSILVNRTSGVVVGLWTALAVGIMLSQPFSFFGYSLVAVILSAVATRNAQRRSFVLRAGLVIGAGLALYTILLGALMRPSLAALGTQAGLAVINGLALALLALVLLPVFEMLFSVTTDIRLLEYSDQGHPLLQRLAKEAPGTYHHSLMVADLARAAASEIGANSLLVRVCAYYHDIGKLTKPEFFTENQQFENNPHDDLAPSMSTLIILAHVKEGVTLAEQYKLPRPIIQGIQQHHGTSMISFFYQLAKKKQEKETNGSDTEAGETTLNEGDFRYEGPKPQTKEMAILHLADSIEAASRAMTKPTHSKIETLVKDLIESRLEDGQLDECNLTMRELTAIRKSFVFNLNSMLHSRIEYPQDEHRNKQQADTASSESTAAETLDGMAVEAGS